LQKIGLCLINILLGFGCKVLAYDVYKNPELLNRAGVTYVEMEEVLAQSDVISLHVPLLPTTRYMINKDSIAKMKKGVM
jgi:D-lactate dehydrogenase